MMQVLPSAAVLYGWLKDGLANSRSTFAHKMQFGVCQAVMTTGYRVVDVAATTDGGVTKFNWIYRSAFSFQFPAQTSEASIIPLPATR